MRSFLKSNQTLKTALLMPVTILPSSHERTEGGKEMGNGGWWWGEWGQLWATCGQREDGYRATAQHGAATVLIRRPSG